MLPLATSTWDEKEFQALQSVIDSRMFTMGEHVRKFEIAFASYFDSKYCVMVNSGSSANLLAVASLFYCSSNELKRGDEVIVPAVSWSTTYYPLHQYGLKLKFVDIDANTLNLDLEQLELAISERTRLIFAVNLLGNPIDYPKMYSLIESKNIQIIEDNCESMGAKIGNKYAGTFGKLGTFSTFFSHHISTMEGGMIVTDDEELYHIILSLRSHGWTRQLPTKNRLCKKNDDPFHESFRFILPGYNVRPLEMSGALGLCQLEKLNSIIEGRRKNAQLFVKLFSNIPGLNIQTETGTSSWFGFALLIEGNENLRTRLVNALTESEIDCRPIVAGNFVRNSVIQYMDHFVFNDLKNSEYLNNSGLFIGNHHYDIEQELHKVSDIVQSVLSS